MRYGWLHGGQREEPHPEESGLIESLDATEGLGAELVGSWAVRLEASPS
jgi:hypothetical protein